MSDLEGGLTFSYIGGAYINCKDCNFSHGLTSFTHGYIQGEKDEMFPSCSSGYQCQSCKFTTAQKNLFAKSEFTHTLAGVPDEERAHRIEHMQSMKKMCESFMKEKPKDQWLETWEPTVKEYTKELNTYPSRIKCHLKENMQSYYFAIVVEVKKGQVLFCPRP